jgi:PhzF family phenazine biosynthesis protein
MKEREDQGYCVELDWWSLEMRRKTFWQVDAFTTEPFCGNPAAVVFEADDLPTETMQAVAREMNLSETVFVVAPKDPKADYGIRIFTPRSELPFAGHPTLAAAFAMLESGRIRKAPLPRTLMQECGMGLVPVEVSKADPAPLLVMTQGRPYYSAAEVDSVTLIGMLGCEEDDLMDRPVEVVSTGVPWMIVPLRTKEAISSLRPDLGLVESVCRECGAVGVTVFCLEAEDPSSQVKVRTFAPGEGIVEDPVCGSGNGSVAAYIARHGLMGEGPVSYWAEQGKEILRPGKVLAAFSPSGSGDWEIRVGGQAVRVIEGEIFT